MDIMYWTFPDRSGKWSIAAGQKDVLACGLERIPVYWTATSVGIVPVVGTGVHGTRWKEGPAVQKGVLPPTPGGSLWPDAPKMPELPKPELPKPELPKPELPKPELPKPELPKVDVWQTQVGGSHYTKLKIQPMQYSMANGLDALQHTVIKYVTRFRDKAGIVDLEKARQTLDLLIAFEKDKKNG